MEAINLIMDKIEECDKLMQEKENREIEYYNLYRSSLNTIIMECIQYDIDIRNVDNDIYQNILSTNDYPCSTHKNHFMRMVNKGIINKCLKHHSTITLKSLIEMKIEPDVDDLFYCYDLNTIKLLLSTKVKFNIVRGKHILFGFVFDYAYEMFEYLINNLNIDCSNLDIELVTEIIQHRTFELIADKIKKFKQLYFEIEYNEQNILILHKNGFDVNERDNYGNTILNSCKQIDSIIEIYLNLGVDPYIENMYGMNYLDLTIINFSKNSKKLKLLLIRGLNIDKFLNSRIWELLFTEKFDILKLIKTYIDNIYNIIYDYVNENIDKFKKHDFKKSRNNSFISVPRFLNVLKIYKDNMIVPSIPNIKFLNLDFVKNKNRIGDFLRMRNTSQFKKLNIPIIYLNNFQYKCTYFGRGEHLGFVYFEEMDTFKRLYLRIHCLGKLLDNYGNHIINSNTYVIPVNWKKYVKPLDKEKDKKILEFINDNNIRYDSTKINYLLDMIH